MIGVAVQARMASTRLPGKVLRDVAGRPLVSWLLERLQHAREVDLVVLTTSGEPQDDAVADLGVAMGVAVHRGSHADVLGRLCDAVTALDLAAVVRVSGDSPLLDQRLVDRAVVRWHETGADVVTNVHPRTFPAGQSVELLPRATLERLAALAVDNADREHVTTAAYRVGAALRIENLALDPPATDAAMVVDTADDLVVIERVLGGLRRPHWDYELSELVDLVRRARA